MACAGVPRHRSGHDADRPGSGDEHVFAEHRKRQRSVNGIAKRIEDRGDLMRHTRAHASRCSSLAEQRIRRTRRCG